MRRPRSPTTDTEDEEGKSATTKRKPQDGSHKQHSRNRKPHMLSSGGRRNESAPWIPHARGIHTGAIVRKLAT
eukprot:871621-Pyramimonas_sp.AAC.1